MIPRRERRGGGHLQKGKFELIALAETKFQGKGYSSTCVRVKGGESECFRIDSGVRQGCIMYPWLFNVYMDGVLKVVKMGMGRRGVSFMEDGSVWRLPSLL